MTVGALRLLEQHFHFVAEADLQFVVPGSEFVDRHQAFGLVADIHDDVVRGDGNHLAGDDFPFVEMAHAVVVHLDELLVGRGCQYLRRALPREARLRKALPRKARSAEGASAGSAFAAGASAGSAFAAGVCFFSGFHGFLWSRFGF